MFKAGDWIVYRSTKHSSHPTPRAVWIDPAPNGEFYTYAVMKYWIVTAVRPDGTVEACTRRGKTRLLHPHDPALRRANWWERLFLAHRFPSPPAPVSRQLTAAG
jgi:hypothetical protein